MVWPHYQERTDHHQPQQLDHHWVMSVWTSILFHSFLITNKLSNRIHKSLPCKQLMKYSLRLSVSNLNWESHKQILWYFLARLRLHSLAQFIIPLQFIHNATSDFYLVCDGRLTLFSRSQWPCIWFSARPSCLLPSNSTKTSSHSEAQSLKYKYKDTQPR